MGSSVAAISAQNVAKSFRDIRALDGVTLSVQRGEFYGLLGPNGAGKTTFLRMVSGFLDPDHGTLTVAGNAPRAAAARSVRGWVPQDIALYEELTARQNLDLFARMYGLGGAALRTKVDELLNWVGLAERAKSRVKTFSGGMKRRLNLAAGLLHDPEIILLDEPTVGVDPQSRVSLFALFQELQRQGKTMVYTTHYMEEAERLCDRIGIIDHGQLIAEGSLPQLLAKLQMRRAVRCYSNDTVSPVQLASATIIPGRGFVDYIPLDATKIGELLMQIEQQPGRFDRVELVTPNLEMLFLELTGRELRD